MTTAQDSPTAYLEDRPLLTRHRARLLGLLGPLLIAGLGTWIAGSAALDRFEEVTIDWRFRARGPRQPPQNILIVEIDEEGRRRLKQDGRRFDLRQTLAAAVNNLADAGALAVGLDVLLEDLTTPEIDQQLARTFAETNVVLALTYAGGRLKRSPGPFLAAQPMEGDISVSPDAGVLRRFPANLHLNLLGDSGSLDDRLYVPHFPLALAWYAALEEDQSARINFDEDGTATIGPYAVHPQELIDFSVTKTPTIDWQPRWNTLRFEDVVRGAFDPDVVDGAIVLVGEAGILLDSFVMPLADDYVPGVYYHANALAHILERRRFNASWTAGMRGHALIAALAFAAGLFAWNQRRWWRFRHSTLLLLAYLLAGAVLFPGGWTYLAFSMFERNILLPVVGPLTAMGISLGSGLVAQWVILSENARRLTRRNRQIEALFGQSVSQNVLDALKHDPERISQTQTRDVSVLFCDLRNFTAQSSKMAPADVAAMLNEYFNYITSAVFQHDGFIDKFVGDEVMAVFSVPFEQPDHPVRAVQTAIAIKHRLAELNQVRLARGQPPLDCGLGIHCGPAAAGHIGSRERSNYTVVGTTVNLAARIEQHTKGGEILISDAVRRCLPPEIPTRLWDRVEIRGSDGRHDLYEVTPDAAVP